MGSVISLLVLIVAIYLVYFGGRYCLSKHNENKDLSKNQTVYFKDSQAAFDYACKYSNNEIKENQGVIAIVKEVLPFMDDEGVCYNKYLILVADDDKGFLTASTTVDIKNQPVKKEDLVIWVPYEYLHDVKSWFGYIRATVAPELSIKNGWTITNKF